MSTNEKNRDGHNPTISLVKYYDCLRLDIVVAWEPQKKRRRKPLSVPVDLSNSKVNGYNSVVSCNNWYFLKVIPVLPSGQ